MGREGNFTQGRSPGLYINFIINLPRSMMESHARVLESLNLILNTWLILEIRITRVLLLCRRSWCRNSICHACCHFFMAHLLKVGHNCFLLFSCLVNHKLYGAFEYISHINREFLYNSFIMDGVLIKTHTNTF